MKHRQILEIILQDKKERRKISVRLNFKTNLLAWKFLLSTIFHIFKWKTFSCNENYFLLCRILQSTPVLLRLKDEK